jgi:hypothetical protein
MPTAFAVQGGDRMKSTTVRILTLITFCIALLGAGARAQVSGGTISGSITDASGAAIPKAAVEVRNTATSAARSLVSNDSGFYSAPNLVPGPYEVKVSAQGFKGELHSDLVLTVGAQLVVNVQMSVGGATEIVNVQGEPSAVETTNATLGGVVNENTVRELPLNARDWTALATLEPGVATIRSQTALAISNNRPIRGLGTEVTIGGNRPQQNNYRLDGVSINDYSNGGPGSVLGIDLGVEAVQEFSVLTSNAPANYGKSSGGIINAVTKSGTNGFHGSAYEFLRNSVFDARNFFDPVKIPPFKRNQFGASAGGPIIKGRTFIFVDYEGLRQSLNVPQTDIVPSPNARAGNLVSGKVNVDAKVAPFLQFYPAATANISGDTGTFSFTGEQITRQNFFTTRLDHRLTSKDNLVGTYMVDSAKSTAPDTYDNVLLGAVSRRLLATLEDTHIFTPAFINTVRFGYSRVVAEAPKAVSAISQVAADPAFGFVPGKAVGAFNVAGLTNFPGGFGAVGEYRFRYNSFQEYDDAFWTKGKHSIKFGGAVERIQINQQGLANPGGVFVFGSLANFLTNKPTSFNAAFPTAITPRRLRQTIFGIYILDDINLKPNFTLNLGLRYEMSTVPVEVDGKISNLRSLTDAQPALGSPYFSNPTLKNFEPRVGLAWDPFRSGKTSVRAGFGLYDVLPLTYNFELLTILSAPFYLQANLGTVPAGAFPSAAFGLLGSSGLRYASVQPHPPRAYVMQWNLNIQREVIRDTTVLIGYVGTRGVHQAFRADDVNVVQPIGQTALGPIWPTPRGSGTRLNPTLGPISALYWIDPSIYHALQTRVSKRMSHGFQIGGSYTWSKSIDEGSSILAGNGFATSIASLPFFDPRLNRSLTDFDIRHVASINYIWELPKPAHDSGILRWAANGWELNGLFQASTGVPFTPTVAGDPVGLNGFQATFAFPDRIFGGACDTAVNPGSIHYINTSCFAFPSPATRLGTARRNSLIGPGLADFDFALVKNTRIPRISEGFNAQFRVEFFNLLNRTNLAPPSNNQIFAQGGGAPLSTAGLITPPTSTPSRQVQFALKLIW